MDDEGYLYVADWGNERVQVLDPDGGFVMKLRGSATLSKWADEFFGSNVEEAEARDTADLEPEVDLFGGDPHEESAHIEKLFWAPCLGEARRGRPALRNREQPPQSPDIREGLSAALKTTSMRVGLIPSRHRNPFE